MLGLPSSGVSACDELLRLGISNLITADSRDGGDHAQGGQGLMPTLAELPMLNRLQAAAGMALARIDWMRDTSAMAVAPRNDVSCRDCWSGPSREDISPLEASRHSGRGILDHALVKRSRGDRLRPQEQAKVASTSGHPLRVAPDWPGMRRWTTGGGSRGLLPIC